MIDYLIAWLMFGFLGGILHAVHTYKEGLSDLMIGVLVRIRSALKMKPTNLTLKQSAKLSALSFCVSVPFGPLGMVSAVIARRASRGR